MNNLIKLTNLTKSYLEGGITRRVLDEVNFDFADGEISILFGRSGSGKSTLLNLLSGIDLPDAGSIEINAIELTKLSESKRTIFRRENIGFIFQFFNLIPTLTVLENLLLPLELLDKSGKKSSQKEKIDKSMTLLEEIDLADRGNSYPDRLSGGEQQRIAIARALVHEPALILADEPTGNLDFRTGEKVIELLDRLVRCSGTTMIMATHSKDVIGVADRILKVSGGKISQISEEQI